MWCHGGIPRRCSSRYSLHTLPLLRVCHVNSSIVALLTSLPSEANCFWRSFIHFSTLQKVKKWMLVRSVWRQVEWNGSGWYFRHSFHLLVCKPMEWSCQCTQTCSERKIWIANDIHKVTVRVQWIMMMTRGGSCMYCSLYSDYIYLPQRWSNKVCCVCWCISPFVIRMDNLSWVQDTQTFY